MQLMYIRAQKQWNCSSFCTLAFLDEENCGTQLPVQNEQTNIGVAFVICPRQAQPMRQIMTVSAAQHTTMPLARPPTRPVTVTNERDDSQNEEQLKCIVSYCYFCYAVSIQVYWNVRHVLHCFFYYLIFLDTSIPFTFFYREKMEQIVSFINNPNLFTKILILR